MGHDHHEHLTPRRQLVPAAGAGGRAEGAGAAGAKT